MHKKRIISLRSTLALLLVVPIGMVVAAVLALSGSYKVYIIHTGSMTPTIPSRSTAAGIVTHRAVQRNIDGSLTTKGDGDTDNDVNVVEPASVIGGVAAAPRDLGYWRSFGRSPVRRRRASTLPRSPPTRTRNLRQRSVDTVARSAEHCP